MTRLSFRERASAGPLVFDGAMGTELVRQGHLVNKSLDGVNLTDARVVSAIHRAYVQAGADVIETNTFAANRIKLAKSGLEGSYEAINREGVRVAREAAAEGDVYVAGAVGPTGVWDRTSTEERPALTQALVDQALLLLDAGADLIIFETFGIFAELDEVVRAFRRVSEAPVVALASFLSAGKTADGVGGAEVGRRLVEAGADVVGANCAEGPRELYDVAEALIGCGKPVAIIPNAGYPKVVDGRMIYMATPEYFGVYARRFLKLGVQIVGGCCGTTPDHVRSMKGAARMMSGGLSSRVEVRERAPGREEAEPLPEIPVAQRSSLAQKVASTEGFVVSVEVNPPTGLDPSKQVAAAKMLRDAGVDVINIADGPRASCRMSNWSLALRVREELGMEAIVHFCARDRNLLGMQSDLLAYSVLGLNNLVVITGDPPKLGDYPNATAVFDLDSVGMLGLVQRLNRGIDPAGQSIGAQTSFFASCGAEPAALDYDRELRRLEDKIRNGASMIMTQPVYDSSVLDRFLTDTAHFNVPVLVGLLPLASYRNAEFLHNEVPGMQVPASIRARMEKVGSGPEARAEGVRIAQEALLAVKERVRGAYIMPPFGRYEAALEILSCIGYPSPQAE